MATIFDVAQLAGVSIKTVSRVVNREARIAPQTLEKVTRAIEMLGYEPHRGARSMRSAKSGLVGYITGLLSSADQPPNVAGLSDVHILNGANRLCREAGKTLLIADMAGNAATAESLLNTFTAHRVEGVIYAAPFHQEVMLPRPKATPLVLVNCFDGYGTPAVVPDDALGQAGAVDHLVRQGHRRIGYIGLHEATVAGRLRKAAFEAACTRHGLDGRECPVRIGGTLSRDEPFAGLAGVLGEVMAQPHRPSALCLGNDIMALHAGRLLEAAGVRVPGDVALMGYDNDLMLCDLMRPRLSTVTLPYAEMGARAAQLLLDLIAGGPEAQPAEPLRVAGDVVVRASSPPPAEAAPPRRTAQAAQP
jgi:LacI family transcriptional regulator